MPGSSILTAEAKKEALAKKRAEIDEHKASLGITKIKQRDTERAIKALQSDLEDHQKEGAKFAAKIEVAEGQHEQLKSAEVAPIRLSANGKPLGRPRLSAEEKERRRSERASTGTPTAIGPQAECVTVPADLQPLIPREPVSATSMEAIDGDTPLVA